MLNFSKYMHAYVGKVGHGESAEVPTLVRGSGIVRQIITLVPTCFMDGQI